MLTVARGLTEKQTGCGNIHSQRQIQGYTVKQQFVYARLRQLLDLYFSSPLFTQSSSVQTRQNPCDVLLMGKLMQPAI